MKLMIAAFATDVLLVLYIEITRHAVETVVTTVRPLIWFHAGISLAVRVKHRYLGFTFCVLRSLNYITSFMV